MGGVAHRRIVGEGVAVVAIEGAAGLDLLQEAAGADIAALVIHVPVLEPEHADIAVGGQADVVGRVGRIEPVRMQPVEGSVQRLGDAPDHLAVEDVRLEPGRGVEALHPRLAGEIDHGVLLSGRPPGRPLAGLRPRYQAWRRRKARHSRFGLDARPPGPLKHARVAR